MSSLLGVNPRREVIAASRKAPELKLTITIEILDTEIYPAYTTRSSAIEDCPLPLGFPASISMANLVDGFVLGLVVGSSLELGKEAHGNKLKPY